jgi:uncharacterized membrane protein YedE/YeeE
MKLRFASLALGLVVGFVFAWARMTDPRTFQAMLSLESPRIYLLMGAAVAIAFVGARLLRGRRALVTGEQVGWQTARPTRGHVVGSVLFGIGWGVSEACPGPTAAALGAGRLLAFAVAAGIVAGVALQPRLARLPEQLRRSTYAPAEAVPASEVL